MSERARYSCCDLRRRNAVDAHPVLNGIDAVEVVDRDLPLNDPLRQRTLLVYGLKSLVAAGLTRDNVRIEGGERIRDPRVEWVGVASAPPPELAGPAEAATAAVVAALPDPDRVLVVRVAPAGDYARYTLRLVQGPFDPSPFGDFDPRMADIGFSFKAECPSELDCQPLHSCPDDTPPTPEIDYLARDYATFRRLLLDRMAQLLPAWRDNSAVDGGIALVELLAYVGDHLSYRQDAIATEAYLGTARQRVSLRRHAQLVDYTVHDGCNARCFVQLQLDAATPQLLLPRAGTQFLTRCDRIDTALATGSPAHQQALRQQPVVFEPMADSTLLVAAHNELRLHTWGDERCCLPVGATRATLRGTLPLLRPGDWLLFEEVRGPRTGAPGDADPAHRQVVRLTAVWAAVDPLPNPPQALTEIEWSGDDALRFPLCLSSVTEAGDELQDVSVARGNLVLADHGRTLAAEQLGTVPAPALFLPATAGGGCDPAPPQPVPVRFHPALHEGPVTQAPPLVADTSATMVLGHAAADALPQVVLTALPDNTTWQARRTLLDSLAQADEFVVEVEHGGRAALRFGDGLYGRRPESGTTFAAVYRVGNGHAGNLGADALHHVVGVDVSSIRQVRNPLPATGGTEPEDADTVRRRAPEAFRRQERAVTPADYAEVTERLAGVQRAAARLRWTGSWHTMFVTVDRAGGAPLDSADRATLATHLDRYRMAGQDTAAESPQQVSLQLALHVCVAPDHFRAPVRAALLALLSRSGLFHPDNFSFGQPVYLSPLIAAAHDVPGVASVSATAFGRQGDDDPGPLAEGVLRLGPREIARLDNDPNFPERGVLTLELHGGQ
jgi:hypothetical protein